MTRATIEFVAEINRVATLVDGGIRVTLDLPETEIAAAAMLMECHRRGAVLRIAAEPDADGMHGKAG